MKTEFTARESLLPGLPTTFLLAGIFAIPLLLWGDRFPWLVAPPIAIMGLLTVRAEWQRMRRKGTIQTQEIEVTFLPPVAIEGRIWVYSSEKSDQWTVVRYETGEIRENMRADYCGQRRVLDEPFAAVA